MNHKPLRQGAEKSDAQIVPAERVEGSGVKGRNADLQSTDRTRDAGSVRGARCEARSYRDPVPHPNPRLGFGFGAGFLLGEFAADAVSTSNTPVMPHPACSPVLPSASPKGFQACARCAPRPVLARFPACRLSGLHAGP